MIELLEIQHAARDEPRPEQKSSGQPEESGNAGARENRAYAGTLHSATTMIVPVLSISWTRRMMAPELGSVP